MTEKLIFDASMGAYVGDGWAPIVNKLYEDMKAIDPDFITEQVKEKFGGLRYYFQWSEGATEEQIKAMDELVYAAEALCYKTCEFCGSTDNVETGSTKSRFWIKTTCASCR